MESTVDNSGVRFLPRENKSKAYCCVYGCNSKSCRNLDIRFHLFPKKNSSFVKTKNASGVEEKVDRREMWQKVLRIRKDVSDKMQVCSLHFKKSDYFFPDIVSKGKRRLKQNAVPSCNLPCTDKPPRLIKAKPPISPKKRHPPVNEKWDTCLLCLKKSDNMNSLQEVVVQSSNQTLLDLLQEFDFTMDIISADSSNFICKNCSTCMQSFYSFKLQCQKSKEFWMNLQSKNRKRQYEEELTEPSTSFDETVFTPEKKIKLEPPEFVSINSMDEAQEAEIENCGISAKIEMEDFVIKEEDTNFYENDPDTSFDTCTIKEEDIKSEEQTNNSNETVINITCACKLTFVQDFQFWNHIKTDHSSDRFIELIPYEEHFKDHIVMKMTFFCKECDLCLNDKNMFLSHLDMHPKYSLNKCGFCDKEYNNLTEYFLHYIEHF